MTDADRYIKIVEWSVENQCYISRSPGLFRGGCHGPDQRKVFDELCTIVEETIAIYHEDGKPLPPPTANGLLINQLQLITSAA